MLDDIAGANGVAVDLHVSNHLSVGKGGAVIAAAAVLGNIRQSQEVYHRGTETQRI
jgi:hypothetical protein